MKTLISITFLALGALPANAGISLADEQLRTFAACAGRLSAQMEHQWMFDGDASEITKRQRAQLIDLVSAVMAPDQGREVLNWRISAKAAHHALLTRATFNDDPADAAWAADMAALQTADCTALLLS